MRHSLRPALLGLGLFALAACESVPSPSLSEAEAADMPPARAEALPAQRLASGQCALFLFERQPPRNFVVFEDEAAGSVQLVHDGVIETLNVSEQGGSLVPGVTFRRVYPDPDNERTFTLSGEVGDETGSGPRLENVLLEVLQSDGERTVRPLGGVRSCGD